MTTKTTKISRGEYKVNCEGHVFVIRQRYNSNGTKKGWLLFSTGESLQTSDSNNWGEEAKTKKEAISWIESYVKKLI